MTLNHPATWQRIPALDKRGPFTATFSGEAR